MPFGAIFTITVVHDGLIDDSVAFAKVQSVQLEGDLQAPFINLQACYDTTVILAPKTIQREVGVPFTQEFTDAYPDANTQKSALQGLFVGMISQQVPAYNVQVLVSLGNVVCP